MSWWNSLGSSILFCSVYLFIFIFRTRCYAREVKSLQAFLESEGFDGAYEAEGAHYWATFSVLLEPGTKWLASSRKTHLAKLITTAQLRAWFPSRLPPPNSTKPPHQYTHIKPSLIFFGLIDAIYKHFFKVCFIFYFVLYVCIRRRIFFRSYSFSG